MKFFGTDGIRGTWGQAPFDEYTLTAIAAAFADYAGLLPDVSASSKQRVVIGHDGRASAVDITGVLTAAFSARGLGVDSPGLVTTPALAYATRAGKYRLGLMISASHNPSQDNGIKPFNHEGRKLDEKDEARIEAIIRQYLVTPPEPVARAAVEMQLGLAGLYAQHIHHQIKELPLPAHQQIVVDCANGGASSIAVEVLRHYHHTILAIHNQPDGHNINRNCGALHPEVCAAEVKKKQSTLGLSFDGDGDRLLAADAKGRVLSGDHILLALVLAAQKRGSLKGGGAVGTVMANYFMEEVFKEKGLKLVRSDVGDKFVLQEMVKEGMNYGGEQSGHIIALDYGRTGDGLLTALLFMAALTDLEETAETFLSKYPPFPQGLKSLRIPAKRPLAELERLQAVITELEAKLQGHGRVLIRYSGTEPKIRLMVEAPRSGEVRDALHQLEEAVKLDFEMPAD